MPLAAVGCFPENHPLPASGTVEILLDDAQPLYAADLMNDETGRPVLPRQLPYTKRVQLLLSDSQQADEGAYVDVRLDPPGVLVDERREDVRDGLVPVDDTCEQLAGAFRCTADEDGYANFDVRSETDWSGTMTVKIAGRNEERSFEVKPAGLPMNASGFTMIIGGLDQNSDKIPASYSRLACNIGPDASEAYDAWPQGEVRSLEAIVRANPPPATPQIVQHAPVIIQTLHSEARLSLDPSCSAEERVSRLRVQLQPKEVEGRDETLTVGESPPFFLCFSDIGGAVEIEYFSGELTNQPNRQLNVEPEPRLLRVVTLKTSVAQGLGAQPVVELSAFDSQLDQISIPVDIASSAPAVLTPNVGTIQLSGDVNYPTQISAEIGEPGSARIQVAPRLFDSPVCRSEPITVTEPSFP
ncbi:MAG: hypothetical protein JRI23_23520 [Deltaproteobacteria bacterium]|nr:hypothetical protein [Deltaproteobacteria bacterium]MBW2534959.1 hypothetical protein [Deltaproteobacteria bacterium]